MRTSRWAVVLAVLLFSSNVWAQSSSDIKESLFGSRALFDIAQNSSTLPQPPQAHPAAITYSNGYEVRAKIHKYASVATIPLFATEFYLGQSLFNGNDSDSKKGLHGAVGAGIVGLFGVNSVTGVWNLWESRHDSSGKSLRTTHGILMLAANAGFVAAAMMTPDDDDRGGFGSDRSTHRNIAIASIGVGTVGYLIMLFRHH
jgi:hypothetical protein